MFSAITIIILLFLTLFAIGYTVWITRYFMRTDRQNKKTEKSESPLFSARTIIGKSHFVLPARRQPTPTTATDLENGKTDEKANIFVPESKSVPQHPRQIPPDKLDDVFGPPPEGESNDPDPINIPLFETSSSDYEADMEKDIEEDDENENESQPPVGRSLAKGVRFEQIGEAYRTVVHDNPLSTEKQQEVGHTLLELKQTDMFEAIVSASPEGDSKVKELMNTYLQAYYSRIAEQHAGSLTSQAPAPEDFDVRDHVQHF